MTTGASKLPHLDRLVCASATRLQVNDEMEFI